MYRRVAALAACSFCVVALAGCDRGWLMNWLKGHGVGEDHRPTEPGSLHLQEVDCPAGLARCVGGAIEVAQAFRHPFPCPGGSEACDCPWQVVAKCGGPCVADAVPLALAPPKATRQLCAVGPSDAPVAHPPPLGTPPPVECGDEPYRCAKSSVIACPSARIVAVCANGCAEESTTLDDPGVDDAAAVYLLCAR